MLKIGDVEFKDFAAPEEWPFGGEQVFAKKRLPGGTHVIQPRGDFYELSPAWEGTFFGPDAYQKVRQLDAYRSKGESLPVHFFTFSVKYFIEKFVWKWKQKDEINFQITLVRDNTYEKKATPDPVIKQASQAKKAPVKTPAKEKVYTVQKGDTLSKIAQKNKTTVAKLASDNKIKNPNKIYIGQKVVIKT
ncbi:LysM peptidoglycan-binding domain-containing protein [Brevibacillus laterosporus]|nr:LysM peptidoglycan-binding domain-containing protein [Brevibacillus laterosporus]TPG74035.1 LysM peptidoglycan-binding domain-containing protein [Brevibacillus laterosporus]